MSTKIYFGCVDDGARAKDRFYTTGEFRAPRKGEWYISGSRPCAYRARNDLSQCYYIAKRIGA